MLFSLPQKIGFIVFTGAHVLYQIYSLLFLDSYPLHYKDLPTLDTKSKIIEFVVKVSL